MAVRKKKSSSTSDLTWPADTELVGLVFELEPRAADYLYPQYTIGLHAWFLDQVRSFDPELSKYLHDGESEKPFTISSLDGPLQTHRRQLQLVADQTYRWYITALSQPVVRWLARWVEVLPQELPLRNAPLAIRSCKIAQKPTTYTQLFQTPRPSPPLVQLSFKSPTSFRRKGHHLPLPWPTNVFHSYLRRWNDFSGMPFEQDAFLEWVDECVLINRHRLESVKVAAGKKGMVTGFTGSIEFGLSGTAAQQPQFEQLFFSLGQLAPYSGTGHKTTFGLGQTDGGWSFQDNPAVPDIQNLLATRIGELTEILLQKQKRTGGNRARQVCETRATILARRELGDSLQAIAQDLDMPYQTVKTYAKLARRDANLLTP